MNLNSFNHPNCSVWYIESRPWVAPALGFAPQSASKGSAVAVRLQSEEAGKKVIKTYLLTCAHVIWQNSITDREILCFRPGVAHHRTGPRQRRCGEGSHAYFARPHSGSPSKNDFAENADHDWVLLEFLDEDKEKKIDSQSAAKLSRRVSRKVAVKIVGYPGADADWDEPIPINSVSIPFTQQRNDHPDRLKFDGDDSKEGMSGGGVFSEDTLELFALHRSSFRKTYSASGVRLNIILDELAKSGLVPPENLSPTINTDDYNIAALEGSFKGQYKMAHANLQKIRYLKQIHKQLQLLEYNAYRPIRDLLARNQALDMDGPEKIREYHRHAAGAIDTLAQQAAEQGSSMQKFYDIKPWWSQLEQASLALDIFVKGVVPLEPSAIPQLLIPTLFARFRTETPSDSSWWTPFRSAFASLFNYQRQSADNPLALEPQIRLACAEQALKVFHKILSVRPSEIDLAMASIAKVTGLETLVDSINKTCTELANRVPQPTGIDAWQNTANQLSALDQELTDLVHEHQLWQKSDNICWMADTNPGVTAGRSRSKHVNKDSICMLSEALTGIKSEINQVKVKQPCHMFTVLQRLEDAIKSGALHDIPTYYDIFRNEHIAGFSHCDDRFLESCDQIEQLGTRIRELVPIPSLS